MADASIRRNRVGIYQVRFRFDNKQFERSLGTKIKREADDRLGEVRKVIRYLEDGVLSVAEGVDPIAFIISGGKLKPDPQPERDPEVGNDTPEVVTLEGAGGRYFDSFPPGSKEAETVKTERTHLKHLVRLLGAKRRLGLLTKDDLQGYVNRRAKEPGIRGKVQRKTIKMELDTFRQIWTWALSRGSVSAACPMFDERGKFDLKLPKADEKDPFKTWDEIKSVLDLGVSPERESELWESLYLDQKQVAELLAYVKGKARHPWIYPMFCFAAFTGARISEICRARVEDVQLDQQKVQLREKKKSKSKNTNRTVPLAPPLQAALREWLARHPGGPHLFCKARHALKANQDHVPLTRLPSEKHFKLTLKGSKWERLRGWHLFRHSFGSNLARSGKVSPAYIDELMGHQTEEMRKRYRHLFPENMRNAVAVLSEMYTTE